MYSHAKFSPVPIVVDAGSYNCKVGFAGMHIPKIVFRTETPIVKKIGDENTSGPISRGAIVDWDGMEVIWDRIFHKELKVNPRLHPVLLTESAFGTTTQRERTVETMFETYSVPSIAICIQPHLALYASGKTTGIVQECGAELCQTVAYYDGHVLPNGIQLCEYGGHDVTELLGRLMKRKGYSNNANASIFLSEVKENFCFVSLNFMRDMSRHPEDLPRRFSLPDGRLITIEEERFKCAESLFNPAFLGLALDGVHQAIYRTLQKCDPMFHSVLYRNVVLSGGASLISDFPNRMRRELCELAGANDNVRVVAPPCISGRRNLESWKRNPNFRKLAVWIGGSLMASTEHFHRVAIQRTEYAEYGTSIIHRRHHS